MVDAPLDTCPMFVKEGGMIPTYELAPVSYTHLDVYKRQKSVSLIIADPDSDMAPFVNLHTEDRKSVV